MNRLQCFRLFRWLGLIFVFMGCTGPLEESQPLSSPPQPATRQAVVVSPSPTAAPSATATPLATPPSEPSATSVPVPAGTPASGATPRWVVANDFRVSYVAEDDSLNIRSGPGIDFEIIGTMPPKAGGIQLTPTQTEADWVEISWQDFKGWVNRYFLVEVMTPDIFCNDPAAQGVVGDFQAALEARDGTGLAQLIQSQRGLLVRLNWWNNEVRFNHQEIPDLFTAHEAHDWGFEDGSGAPLEGSFNEVVVPILDRDFAGTRQVHCNELVTGGSAGIIRLPFEYEAVNYYAVHRPPEENELDWGTWVLGLEYWGGKPHLSFLVHYQWEI